MKITISSKLKPGISCLLLALTALGGCAPTANVVEEIEATPAPQAAPEIYLPPIEEEYRIAVGDNVTITSYVDDKLHQELVVRPDGRISVLFLGDIKVIGMTPNELDTLLTESYAEYLHAPEVTVVVDPAAMAVYVGGEVSRPSMIPLKGDLTLLQAIIAAGGVMTSGDAKQVLLMRRGPSDMVTVSRVNLTNVLESGAPDLYVRQYDTVYVPKTGISNIGDFVDAYINRIIPNAVHLQYIWSDNDGQVQRVDPSP